MKKSHLAAATVALLAAAAGAGGACTYQTYIINETSSTSGGGGGPATSTASASSSGTGGAGGAGTGGASSSASASSSSGMVVCPADDDHDMVISVACDGGTDCADNDGNAHPGQMGWFTKKVNGTQGYDFDCNGKDELQFADLLTCPDAILGCDGKTERWMNGPAPSCGETADYGVCNYVNLACQKKKLGTRTQGCH